VRWFVSKLRPSSDAISEVFDRAEQLDVSARSSSSSKAIIAKVLRKEDMSLALYRGREGVLGKLCVSARLSAVRVGEVPDSPGISLPHPA